MELRQPLVRLTLNGENREVPVDKHPTDRPLVACLLPVHNGAAHLDGWLASVERFADVMVAL